MTRLGPKQTSGRLIIVAGPSGSGKTTIVDELKRAYPDLIVPPAITTRPPRPHEQPGLHYHFVSKETFQHLIEAGEMLEYTEYNHNLYGTQKAVIEYFLSSGRTVILVLEVKGIEQILKIFPEAKAVFLITADEETLRQRLRKRKNLSPENIEDRILTAQKEIARAKALALPLVVSDSIKRTATEVEALLGLA